MIASVIGQLDLEGKKEDELLQQEEC